MSVDSVSMGSLMLDILKSHMRPPPLVKAASSASVRSVKLSLSETIITGRTMRSGESLEG